MFRREPALIVSAIVAFLTETFGLAIAFGIDISDSQQKAIVGTVTAAATVIVLLGPIVRGLVYAPATVQKKVDEAANKGAAGEVQSPVVP